MKNPFKIIAVLFLITTFSCDSEDAPGCLQSAGTPVEREIVVNDFTEINVDIGIELIIREGAQTSVVVKSGENLTGNVTAKVENGVLFLKNNNGCNWVRDYNTVKVYVTTPSLLRVYSASQFAVKSDGVLHFPQLSLQSAIFDKTASGTFELDVDCQSLTIEDNAAAFFSISGTTVALSVNFYDGNSRFDGTNLTAQTVYVFQRSSNDMIVRPIKSLTGIIYSTGNVIIKGLPPIIDVTRLYQGKLIFE